MTEKLIEIFRKETGIRNIEINKDFVLRTDLNINSYDFIQIVCAVEDEFDIEIPDKDLAKMITVGDVVAYIESHIWKTKERDKNEVVKTTETDI